MKRENEVMVANKRCACDSTDVTNTAPSFSVEYPPIELWHSSQFVLSVSLSHFVVLQVIA